MNFKPDDLRISLVITGVLVFFYLYYYTAHSSGMEKWIYKNTTGITSELRMFLFRKLSGFTFLGVMPAILYFSVNKGAFARFGFSYTHIFDNIFAIAGMMALIAILLFFRHRKNPALNTLQIKTDRWSSTLMIFDILGWSLYLLAYEFLFRGILLFECYDYFGFLPAIVINIALYSAIHMVNGKEQAVGAIFFGAVACYLTLQTGTILIAFFMHIALSGFSDYFSVRMNPAIRYSDYRPLKSGEQ
jgi:membrane protease YdiL (CAAX protease family)